MPLPFALDHINLWLLADDDGYTLVDCGFGDAADARAVGAAFRDDARATGRSAASSRRTAIPITSATRRGSRAALRRADRDDARRISDRARVAGQHGGYSARRDARASSRRHGMAGRALDALGGARQQLSPRRAGAAAVVRPDARRRHACDAAARRGASSPGYGHSPEHASLHSRRARRADRRRHAAAARSAPTSASGPVEPDGDPLARFLDSLAALRGAAARHAGAAVARAAVSRHRRCASRSCARTTPRGSPSSRTRVRASRRAAVAQPTSSRCCSGASSTCSSATSRWARRSPISITCGTPGALERRVARRRRASLCAVRH